MRVKATEIWSRSGGSMKPSSSAFAMADVHWPATSGVIVSRAWADITQAPGRVTNQSRGPPSQAVSFQYQFLLAHSFGIMLFQ